MILLRLYKGGGSVQTVDAIPEWAVPYIKNVMNTGEALYSSGKIAQVAGSNANLNAAQQSGGRAIADTTNRGLGALQGQQDRLNAMAQAGDTDVSGLNQAARIGYDTSKQAALGSGAMNYNTQGMDRLASGAGNFDTSGMMNIGTGGRDYDSSNIKDIAATGGYDTKALKDKAILEAGQRTADLSRQMGQAGTLGSARQAVMQGAQNAATAAEFATIDRDAAQQMLQNRMNAEQLGLSAHGTDTQARLQGLSSAAGVNAQNFGNMLNAMQASAGANAQNANTMLNAMGQEMQGHGQNFNQFLQGTQAALAQGNQDRNFRLQAENTLGGSVAGAQQLAGNASNALGQLGTAQRGLEQEQLDIPWTSLQRYASTIYGNPARQSGIAGGGGK